MSIKSFREWLQRRPRDKQVSAVPTWYHKVHFRSTLEADWAHTFDCHGIAWSYEPIALTLSDGTNYRPDFYLPNQQVWCEVKGPHNVRIEKPRRLAHDLVTDPFDILEPLIVVLRMPVAALPTVESARNSDEAVGLSECSTCGNWTFVNYEGAWVCRVCYSPLHRPTHEALFMQLPPITGKKGAD